MNDHRRGHIGDIKPRPDAKVRQKTTKPAQKRLDANILPTPSQVFRAAIAVFLPAAELIQGKIGHKLIRDGSQSLFIKPVKTVELLSGINV